ncbi:MAG TPA: DUF4870 domain-containing protein [Candidatus Dormibacteraeota bacterium]
MQNPPGPPPGPPPGQPQSQPPATTAGGIDKRTGAFLSYLVGWLTGIIFLFVGKNDPDVKYHAAQSLVVFGSLQILQIVINIISGFVHVLGIIGLLIGLLSFVLWIVCLVKAWTGGGQRFEVPFIGGVTRPYVEQVMGMVS